MITTKEKILLESLNLFSQNGYVAVSVSKIADAVGITKGALYKHYKNKRDIFDSIVERMAKHDAIQAQKDDFTDGTIDKQKNDYQKASMSQIIKFSLSQFEYWTEDDFASSFRKMLTLEQFHSKEMSKLYQLYLVAGPIGYVEDLFSEIKIREPYKKAVEIYAPMFFYYSMYDGAEDKNDIKKAWKNYINDICKEWSIRI